MKLSAVLLQEKLGEIISSCHFGKNSEQLNLSRPEFIAEKRTLESGHLYITLAESLPKTHRISIGCCIVCVGEPSPEYFGQGYTVICIRRELDIFDVFNRLGAIFELYDNWERQLLHCINERTPIQRFVDISTSIFENQIYIIDSTLRQLAKSKYGVFSNISRDIIVEDMEKLARLYASAQSISNKEEATILWNEYLQLRVITKALRSHNRFAIAVTLIEANRPFLDSDIVLLDYMSYYVLMAFDYGHTSVNEEESPISLATVLAQLFQEEIVPIERIRSAEHAFGWEPEHLLCLFYVKTPRPEHNFATRIFQCQQMERQFTSAIGTASLGDDYAVIVNISLSVKYNDSISRFDSVMKKYSFVSGMSCEFSDITKVKNYYVQAKYAYYYGSIANPGNTIYKFSDYGLQFMLSHCNGGQDLGYLFPSGLKEMIAHDNLYGTSYLKTLIAYCDCKFNATHAAKRLDIHRTTFLDRLSRICDFLMVDFDNPSDRLHLLMSLELIKTQK